MIDTQTAWDAVQRRDRAFDGRFVTGVLTTGIYCRPSCAARHASLWFRTTISPKRLPGSA